MKKKNTLKIISLIVFFLGVAFGAAFFTVATWGDIESAFYAFPSYGYRSTNAMHCPIFMTTSETGIITASFKNNLERRVRPNVRLIVSPLSASTERITIEPGESQQLSWEVFPDQIGLRNFIFAKLVTYAGYPMPNMEQTCGILVLNLPGMTGLQITLIALISSVLLMTVGIVLWNVASRRTPARGADIQRALILLTFVTVIGIVFAFMGWWLLGVIVVALFILLIGVLMGSLIQER